MSTIKLSSLIFSFILFLVFNVVATAQEDEKVNSYVGAETCGMCHKSDKQGNQLDIWKKSEHAKAFVTLQSEKADKIAKDLGYTTPAAETEACLKCHVSGFGLDASLLGPKFKMSDGVQCETCHGAGSNYKSLKIMKDKKEAIANGLIVPEKIEDLCAKCHNAESPTFVEMNFEEAWNKIKHPIPGK